MGELIPLASVSQKNGKVVHAWAFEADFDLARVRQRYVRNGVAPKSGHRLRFPEIDRIAYFTLPVAMSEILAYQRPLLRRA